MHRSCYSPPLDNQWPGTAGSCLVFLFSDWWLISCLPWRSTCNACGQDVSCGSLHNLWTLHSSSYLMLLSARVFVCLVLDGCRSRICLKHFLKKQRLLYINGIIFNIYCTSAFHLCVVSRHFFHWTTTFSYISFFRHHSSVQSGS